MTEPLSFFMPLYLKKRGGRTTIIVPEGQVLHSDTPIIDQRLFKALVRAHLWQRQLRNGKYATIEDLAHGHKLTRRYVQGLLPLNYLSTQLKEAILAGTQPQTLKLADIQNNVPMLWAEQCTK